MNLFSKLLLGLDTKAFRSGIANADSSLKKFSGQLKNLGGLIGATFIGSQIASFTKEALELGSSLQKAAAGFARFGSEADLDKLRNQTRGLVSDVEIMQQTVKGANLGIPFKDMGVLLQFAKRRADETGESIENLINSIIEGVGRKSTRRLDNLGISADRLKDKIGGISLEMASVADVSRAMTDIAKEELDKMGDPADNATDAVQRLYVAWNNLKASIGQDISPAVTTAVSGLEEFWRASVALYQGRYMKDIIRPMIDQGPDPTMPGLPGATVGTDPNPPQGPTTTAAPFGVYAPAPTTLKSLQEGLKALQEQYEVVAINSDEFIRLRGAIEAAEQKIKDLTDGVVPHTEAINLQAKGLHDVNYEYGEHAELMRQISPVYNELAIRQRQIAENYAQWNRELETMSLIGEQFGTILSSAFEAALINGDNFFDTIKKSFKNYIAQVGAMTAATTLLAVAVAFVTGGANFKAAFNNIGGGMGLPFGIDDSGQLKFRIAGFGMEASNGRNQRGLNILGN